MTRSQNRLAATALFVALSAGPVLAVDGVIQINQARALAGGVTTGDAAGFPVGISESGSYRLTGNLTVPNENTSAISIEAGAVDVTIDLNGFTIAGPVTCSGSGSGVSCAPSGSGSGIVSSISSVESVSIANGSIRGMGSFGIQLTGGPGAQIQNVRVSGNGGGGIRILHGDNPCIVSNSFFLHNAGSGIELGNSCMITGNRVLGNRDSGINAQGGVVRDNTVEYNGQGGISQNSGYAVIADNSVSQNEGLGIEVGQPGNLIRGNTVGQNGAGGIYATNPASLVTGNTVDQNQGNGIEVGDGANVTGNSVGGNDGNGIIASGGSTVQQNSVYANSMFGLDAAQPETGYNQNVFLDNDVSVNDGTQTGTNLCDGTPCP